MSNIAQLQSTGPIQRFISEQHPNLITLVPPVNNIGDEDSAMDDHPSLSPAIASQAKIQAENQSIGQCSMKNQSSWNSFMFLDSTLASLQSTSSASSSFLTATQPSTTDPSISSTEPPHMTSSPNHEHESILFEPCRTSSHPDESVSSVPSTIQSNLVDELEQ